MLLEVGRMYARCRSMFMAMRRLVVARLAEDAQIIGRSLFDSSLRIEYLAEQSDLDREALLIQFPLDGLVQFEMLTDRKAPKLAGGSGLSVEEAEALAGNRKDLLTRQKRLGINRLKGFPSEQQMAAILGRQHQLLDFELSHNFVHGSWLAQESRTKYPKQGTMHVYTFTEDYDMLSGVGVSAARNALRALSASVAILGWVNEGTDVLIAEADTL